MTGTYELTKYQWTNLKRSAKDVGYRVFGIVEPSPDDTQAHQYALTKELKEMADLVELGLLTDESEKFNEAVENSKLVHKRGFRVFAITEAGHTMFRDGSKKVN